jgi:Skp family chaperone for outer membrane proteins
LSEIRKNFTPSLGHEHGRVVLKAAKPHLEQRLAKFREELKAHQERIEKELQGQLDASRKQIVEYFVPRVVESPPDAMRGQFLKFSVDEARDWLNGELERVFPKADALIQKMQLDVQYKDVTFETLNREDFLEAVKEAFPRIDWEKTYKEFRAAGEKDHASRSSVGD